MNKSPLEKTPPVELSGPTGDIEAPGKQLNVGEWLKTWYELYAQPDLRQTTQEYYSNFIKYHLVPHVGDIPLNELTGLRLQRLYQELRTNGRVNRDTKNPGLSPKTIRGIHMMLHNALEQAVKEELIKKNPTNDCKPPASTRKF